MLPIPIGTDRPQRRLPLMNLALIATNIIIYLVSHHAGRMPRVANLAPGWPQYMLDPRNPTLLQFFTYQFLHQDLGHIGFNMLFLYVFGNNLNEKLGHLGYLTFYLTGGILAGCGQMLTSSAPTLGASGALSAVAGMFLVLLPRTHIRMFIWIVVYVDIWEIPSAWFILFSVAKDIFEPVLWHDNSTAYAAHLSGNLSGFVVGMLLLLTRLVQRDHYDLLAVIDRYRRRKQYESMVASGYNPWGAGEKLVTRERRAKTPPPPVDPRIEQLRYDIGDLIHKHNLPAAAQKYLELRQIVPEAVLTAPDQLDVANQLMAESRHQHAAAAYEDYLRLYPNTAQHEQVMLILALIYGQYLAKKERAVEILRSALPRLHDPQQRVFAEEELARLQGMP